MIVGLKPVAIFEHSLGVILGYVCYQICFFSISRFISARILSHAPSFCFARLICEHDVMERLPGDKQNISKKRDWHLTKAVQSHVTMTGDDVYIRPAVYCTGQQPHVKMTIKTNKTLTWRTSSGTWNKKAYSHSCLSQNWKPNGSDGKILPNYSRSSLQAATATIIEASLQHWFKSTGPKPWSKLRRSMTSLVSLI